MIILILIVYSISYLIIFYNTFTYKRDKLLSALNNVLPFYEN